MKYASSGAAASRLGLGATPAARPAPKPTRAQRSAANAGAGSTGSTGSRSNGAKGKVSEISSSGFR